MSNVKCIIGLQWGNEGKDRISHHMANNAICIRSIGVNNKANSVVVKGKKIDLYVLPASIIKPNNIFILSSGMAVDLEILYKEIFELQKAGIKISPKNLIISPKANIIMPYHIEANLMYETAKPSQTWGIRQKGIAPCYSDNLNGFGITMHDLVTLPVDQLMSKLEVPVQIYNTLLSNREIKFEKYTLAYSYLLKYKDFFSKFVEDEFAILFDALNTRKKIILEASNTPYLDVVCEKNAKFVYGIMKAYSTQFADGPFVTEECNEIGETIRKLGHEYDSTTGQARRCGWLDLVQVKSAIISNVITGLCLNHLDTIGNIGQTLGYIKVCIAYTNSKGEKIDYIPSDLENWKPIYHIFEGDWQNLSLCSTYDDLPKTCRDFIEFIEDYTGIQVKFIGTGPHLNNTIVKL